MDRKDFMRDVYSKYWLDAREKKYGFLNYDKHLCDLIIGAAKPESGLLEVAIGTGYPIADFLQKAGYSIHGIDISPALIDHCRSLNPAIEATVGDAENLDYEEETFDCAYCFHSTWVIPDVARTISEMLRVTRPDGSVIFDVQNRSNALVAAAYDARVAALAPGLVNRTKLQARNVAKVVLRRGNPNWKALNYEVPAYPEAVFELLRDRGVTHFRVLARNESDESLIAISEPGPLADYPRLVVVARRPAILR